MTDQDHEPSESGNPLERVLQILKEIAEKSADGDYLYRGEPEHYPNVSSGLYRKIEQDKLKDLDIERAQEEILIIAKEFASQMDDDEDLLAQLQHYGSATNLIDFSTDYLIALFFACDSEPSEDGRVILLLESKYSLHLPRTPLNRVIAQKEHLRATTQGLRRRPDESVCIPRALKQPVLEYLNRCHGIRPATIFNDLNGFIRYHQGHESAYVEFYAGSTLRDRGEYCAAIERYSNAIRLNPQLPPAHNNRGNAYEALGKQELAIQDYSKAIELNPLYAGAYNNRGLAYVDKGDLDRAIRDYDRAIELNLAFALAYCNRGLAYMKKGEHDRAIEDFDRAIALSPNDAKAYEYRGIAYGHRSEFDHAIQNFDRAIRLDFGDADAFGNRGYAYMLKGELSRAIGDYDQAIARNPKQPIAIYNRGVCWLLLGIWERSQVDLATAQELGLDLVSTFLDEFNSVVAFEERFGIKVPSDIVAMLT